MNIVYFNANLRKGQDGVTRVVYKMIEGALIRHHNVIAITSTTPNPADQIVPMYRVPSVVLPLQKNYRIALPGYRQFSEILKNFRPDILHINSPCTLGFGAVKYAKQYAVPVVATYHTHFPAYPRYYGLAAFEPLSWRITQNFYNQMNCTFVPTQPILEELQQHNIRQLVYLPNGVDTKLFHPSKRSEEWRRRFGNAQKPIILFVSRLVWEKDLLVLAQAYNYLRSHRNDFDFVVIGDGHARKEFEAMMPGAHFLGYQSGETLAESFASSDIFVFPSTTETFGLVTLEAMASGLVPIAAKVGGAVELIEENKSGLFAKPLDGIDLAHKIEMLLDNPEVANRMRGFAYQRAQHYRWEQILDALFTKYEEVVKNASLSTFTIKAA
jgi:glycosyltransferase involved in cell wall biosynthesis